MIDDIDQKILSIIQGNARTSNAEIARQVGMAPSAVLERIRKLEEKGVIRGYEVRLNPRALELGLVAFVSVRTKDRYGSLETAENLAKLPEVLEVHHTAGEDLLFAESTHPRHRNPGAFSAQKNRGKPQRNLHPNHRRFGNSKRIDSASFNQRIRSNK